MRLLKAYNNYYIKIIGVLLILGSIVIFFTFKVLFEEEIHEQLQYQKEQLLTHDYSFINPANRLPIEGVFTDTADTKGKDTVYATSYYDQTENDYIPFEEFIFYKPSKDHFIKFTVRKSLVEFDDLLYTLIITIITIFLIFTVVLYFLNRKITTKLFTPFFNSIHVIKENETFLNSALNLPETPIEEFSMLNAALNSFDERLRVEYKKIAQFTDNVSHELQTPIAILSNRVESILENGVADQKTKQELADIFETIQQIRKINETLFLMSRLESKSFRVNKTFDLNELIDSKIQEYLQFGFLNNLRIEKSDRQPFIVQMNEGLAMILVTNLLNNAVKHNIESGFIKIKTSPSIIEITNSGLPLNRPAKEMLGRFEKGENEVQGLGLGLSIVLEICNQYGLGLTYSEKNGDHIIQIAK